LNRRALSKNRNDEHHQSEHAKEFTRDATEAVHINHLT